jgi:acetoin utilization protein AcuB
MQAIEYASREPVTVPPDAALDVAAALMERCRLRHLPVAVAGRLLGMVSDRDVKRALGGSRPRLRRDPAGPLVDRREPMIVSDVMSRPALSVPPDTAMATVARVMIAEKISSLPVVRDDRLVGLITETDLLRAYSRLPDGAARALTVAEAMTVDPQTIPPTASVQIASQRMRSGRIRHLLVTADGRLAGIISDRDLARAFGSEDSSGSGERLLFGRGTTPVEQCMQTVVQTAEPGEDLRAAADRMIAWKVGALAVLQEARPVGILTETDVLTAFARATAPGRLCRSK